MNPELLQACTIIDRMRMRQMVRADEQITRKEIETFFKEVGYVTEIDREADRSRNRATQNGQEAAIYYVQKVPTPLADNDWRS